VELVETFEDLDLSAYSRRVRRPGLEKMLSRLGEVDTVVTWRLDRLARSVSGFSKLLETFDEARVKMATTDGQVDMTSVSGGR
jgi:site-specific DNA recombinase